MYTLYRDEMRVFTALCRDIATPLAEKAVKLAHKGDWLALLSIEVDPRSYTDAQTYLGDVQVVSFWKKLKGLSVPGIDPKAAAHAAFWEAERQCYWSNERLAPLLSDLGHYGEGVRQLVVAWRKEMRRTLGRAPVKGTLSGRFGPGSTFANTADSVTVVEKMTENYTRTRRTNSFLQWWDETAWSRYAACNLTLVLGDFAPRTREELVSSHDSEWMTRDFDVVPGNRFTTVEKTYKTKRGICIEPSLNVFAQLAVGSVMSDRMKRRIGWDKETCQEYHRTLARIASMTGSCATIDLSKASDTVCYNLVRLVGPKDWFKLWDDLRSPYTYIGQKWVKLEKFSSMGNGFTFELETALFVSLCNALKGLQGISEDDFTPGLAISVFGDDIIVPTSLAELVVKALHWAGFETNREKTFLSGPFRESCGGDFFKGIDVRPIYLRKAYEEPESIISSVNALRRFYRRYNRAGRADLNWSAWHEARFTLPTKHRNLFGPEDLGDLVINTDDQSLWRYRTKNSRRLFTVWRPVPHPRKGWDQYRPGVTLAAALYGTYVRKVVGSADRDQISELELLARDKALDGTSVRINGSYIAGYKFGSVAYS